MIPPIASSLPLRIRREKTTNVVDRDDANMVARIPEVLLSDRDEASCCSGNATMPAEVSFDVVRAVVRRKRVTFADDQDPGQGTTPEIALHRSPTGAKRRRTSLVWNAALEQHTDLDQSQQHRSNAHQPLSSSNYNRDVSGKFVAMSSSDDEDLLQTTPNTAAIPADPRLWTRSDVHIWLRQTTRSTILSNHGQQQPIEVDFERFRMNGKALCLMSSDMFAYRVPHGGHLLYKDFQVRLCRAVADSLHRNCTVG